METNWQSPAHLASRVCPLGPQPGSVAGIRNLRWVNAVPSVCTSGLSINADVLKTDELYVMLEPVGEDWAHQAP